MEEEIRDLAEKTARTRWQFLNVELRTCVAAIDLAKYELSHGNIAVVEKEIAAVEKGIAVIERFLPKVEPEQRAEMEPRLSALRTSLEALKDEVRGTSETPDLTRRRGDAEKDE